VALLGDRIAARTGSYELGAELWEVAGRWTLVISGAAYPRDQQAMRSRLRGLMAEAAGAVSDASVRNHAAQIRVDLLLASATPWGLADLVGQALDLGEEPAGIQQLLDQLAGLGGSDLSAFFDALSRRTPIRDEVRP
jgi:predicted Zn-dependent peptidase